jgi:hypothetical protein
MCRDFAAKPVDAALLARVTAAAFRGPAAGNAHALDLVVLTGSDVQRCWDATLPTDRREAFPWPGLLQAPALVLVVVDPMAYVDRYGEPDKAHTGLGTDVASWPVPYWFVDGGAAVMALLLAAEAAGLGALFFGQFDHEEAVRRTFGVPTGRRAVGTVALGQPADGGRVPSASGRRGRPSAGDHTHAGQWSNVSSGR